MPNTQQRHVLTEQQMDDIRSATRHSWVDGILATYRAMGVDLTKEPDKPIRPMDYAIPRSQWEQICAWMFESPGSDLVRVNHGLDWMNKGPSAYEDE